MAEQRKTDRRIVKTETAIKSAFIDLLKKKGFEAITVNDIVNAVNISRGTFYLHYLDKYDLLAKMQDEFLDDLSENLKKYYQSTSSTGEPQSFRFTSRGYVEWLLSKFKENRDLLLLYLNMDGEFSFVNKLRKLFEYNLENNLYPWLDSKSTVIPIQYVVSFIYGSDVYVIIEWLENGCKEPSEDIASYILEMDFKGPYNVLKPVNKNDE